MLSVYLIGAGIIGGFACFGVFLACFFTMISLLENGGSLSRYERDDLQGIFKACFFVLGFALIWPALVLYFPFLIYYHVFTDNRRDQTFPRPSFLAWGKEKVDADSSSW